MASKAFKNLVAALEAGYLESKKQQDHFFKVLNGQNEEAKEIVKEAFGQHGEIRLSEDQQEQGHKWLLNLWQTPSGKERLRNPFGIYEQKVIENFVYITLSGWRYHSHCEYAYPVYTVYDIEGDYFKYTMAGGDVKIVG